MKVRNVHERTLTASPEEVAALFANMDQLWPDPVPEREDCALRVGPMLWERVERPDSPAAYRIVSPDEFPAEHWFEVAPDPAGSVLRHTVEGEALGSFEPVWLERVEPMHNAYIEALFDRAQEALS